MLNLTYRNVQYIVIQFILTTSTTIHDSTINLIIISSRVQRLIGNEKKTFFIYLYVHVVETHNYFFILIFIPCTPSVRPTDFRCQLCLDHQINMNRSL